MADAMILRLDQSYEKPRLQLPGNVTRTGWELPTNLSLEDWLACGVLLRNVEGAVQWWLGDWWNHGIRYGKGEALAERAGVDYGTMRNYASVANAFELSFRNDNLGWSHHKHAMAVEGLDARLEWLRRAETEDWSANDLKREIASAAAISRTNQIELNAQALGKFAVLYADPPWQYEHAPAGGDNRSIEKEYPTMSVEEICDLPVAKIAHDNAVLLMWATSPKMREAMMVLDAWQFEYRTNAAWVKDKIGTGYHFREQHELLLVAKRGELPPPAAENRPPSVFQYPRLEHSAKPIAFYDVIDRMYPDIRKLELFGRAPEKRPLWTTWGNQA